MALGFDWQQIIGLSSIQCYLCNKWIPDINILEKKKWRFHCTSKESYVTNYFCYCCYFFIVFRNESLWQVEQVAHQYVNSKWHKEHVTRRTNELPWGISFHFKSLAPQNGLLLLVRNLLSVRTEGLHKNNTGLANFVSFLTTKPIVLFTIYEKW